MPWIAWASAMLVVIALIVVLGDHAHVFIEHWQIAIAMAIGSYVAGSTPMGGGTVGFPVLVLLLGEPASFGRQFSFMIQAVGMTSASIFILCSGRPVAWRVLAWACGASFLSLIPGYLFVAPVLNDSTVKLTFASIWGAFGLLALAKRKELLTNHGVRTLSRKSDALVGISAGLLGGFASSLTGVGIDMVVFVLLVLLYRTDLRIAVATSVIAMAMNSLAGTALVIASGRTSPLVFDSWLAAAPVVLFGAPIGAFAVSRLPRGPTLVFVSLLCVVQLLWALRNVEAQWLTVLIVGAVVLGINVAFIALHALGDRLVPPSKL